MACATRTVPPLTVGSVGSDAALQSHLPDGPVAVLFYDPTCERSQRMTKRYNDASRTLLAHGILPLRARMGTLPSTQARWSVGGAPKLVYHDPQFNRTRRFRDGSLDSWIADRRELLMPQYTLHTAHDLVNDDRPMHLLLFLSPHAESDYHLRTIRALRQAADAAAPTAHVYWIPYDTEHRQLLRHFGLLSPTGGPNFQYDRILVVCGDDQTEHDVVSTHTIEPFLRTIRHCTDSGADPPLERTVFRSPDA